MKRYLSYACALAVISLLNSKATAQTAYDWTGANNGAWLTTTNWANGVVGTYPGVSGAAGAGNAGDVARFTNASTGVGIDMAAATGQLSLGAIDYNSLTSLTISNSSATTGILQLNGATVNAVANTLISVGSAGGNLTIANGTSTMGLRLGITNGVFNVAGNANPGGIRVLNINTIISEANAGSGFMIEGGGSVLLSQANTFTGDVTVNNGRVQISNPDALGTGAGKTIVNNGGTLFLNTALTVNENIDFAGNGYTELVTLFGAIRIGNVATTLNGNLTMTDHGRIFVQGNTTTLNGGLGETGGARNLNLAGGGTLALASAGSFTGTTTITQSTLNVTGDNGVLSGTTGITVAGAGTFRLSNTTGTGNVGNRLNDAASVTLNGGTFNFNHPENDNATSFAETVGNLIISHHLNTVSTNTAMGPQTSTLTFNNISRAVNTGGVHFTGIGLGGSTANQVLFTTAPTLVGGATQAAGGIIPWATYNVSTTTADFASYGANGVMAMGNVTTNLVASGWTPTHNAKVTLTGGNSVTSQPAASVNSLTVLLTGGTVGGSQGDNLIGDDGGNGLFFNYTIGTGSILQTANGDFQSNIASNTTLATLTNEYIFNINAGRMRIAGPLSGGAGVGITKLGSGLLILDTPTISPGGPLVIMGNGGGSAVRIDNNNGLGNISSVTLKAGTGGDGSVLNLNTGMLAAINKPLFMEAFMTGGLSTAVSAAGVTGLNARSALITNSNNTWSGTITLTGNHYAQFYQNTAGSTLTLSGPINAGAGGFTGLLLARGAAGGIVNITGAINLPQGTIAATTGAIVFLPAVASNVFGLNAQAGSIRLGGNNVLPATTIVAIGQNGSTNEGQFWTNGFNQTIAALNIQTGSTGVVANEIVQNGANANSTLTFAGNALPSTFAGTIRDDDPAAATTGILGITQTAGNLTLSGANTYTGVTALNGGQLSIPSISNATVAGPLGSAAVAATNLVINGGTLNFTGASASTDRGFTAGASGATINVATAASNLTLGGNSVMTGALNKVGPGTLTLSGANTGAGVTNVNAGTLRVNNTSGVGTGTGLTTVANGATIGGNGTIGGSLTISNGATLSPGNSVGTLNAAAGTTEWAGGGRYLVEYDHSSGSPLSAGSTIDLYNSAGSLNLSASTGTPFIIELDYLGASNAGLQTPQTIRIATFAGGLGTVSSTQFTFTGDFVASSPPSFTLSGNDLVLNFTPVPEPATVGLFAAAIAGFAVRRMRKRAA